MTSRPLEGGAGKRGTACEMHWAHAHLEGLLREVDVLDGEQAGAEGGHCAMPHDGGARRRQHIRQEGDGAGGQEHDVRVVLGVQQVHLQAAVAHESPFAEASPAAAVRECRW